MQIDASIHDWLEGRGDDRVLITLLDDATGYLLARFSLSATVAVPLDRVGRWLRRHGRPLALDSDRHSIFEPQDKGKGAVANAETQLGRAFRELGIELIRVHSPQASGRRERSFGTAHDRWVKKRTFLLLPDTRGQFALHWEGRATRLQFCDVRPGHLLTQDLGR